jgi:hypothetical protein
VQASDPLLFLAELALVCAVFTRLLRVSTLARALQVFYDDLVTFCQANALSVTELATVTTFFIGFLFFDLFCAFLEEDLADVVSYAILALIVLTLGSLALCLDLFVYFLVSSTGGAGPSFRSIATDLINNSLCLLRIFVCWTRYIFYDMQTEFIDFNLQYTDIANESMFPALEVGLLHAANEAQFFQPTASL